MSFKIISCSYGLKKKRNYHILWYPRKVIKRHSSPFTTKSSCSWDTWTRLWGTTTSFSSSSSISNDATSCWKSDTFNLHYMSGVHVWTNEWCIIRPACLTFMSAHFPWNTQSSSCHTSTYVSQFLHVTWLECYGHLGNFVESSYHVCDASALE